MVDNKVRNSLPQILRSSEIAQIRTKEILNLMVEAKPGVVVLVRQRGVSSFNRQYGAHDFDSSYSRVNNGPEVVV